MISCSWGPLLKQTIKRWKRCVKIFKETPKISTVSLWQKTKLFKCFRYFFFSVLLSLKHDRWHLDKNWLLYRTFCPKFLFLPMFQPTKKHVFVTNIDRDVKKLFVTQFWWVFEILFLFFTFVKNTIIFCSITIIFCTILPSNPQNKNSYPSGFWTLFHLKTSHFHHTYHPQIVVCLTWDELNGRNLRHFRPKSSKFTEKVALKKK